MRLSILDWLLIAVIAVGGVMAFGSGRERARLEARATRLAAVAGDLPVADPAKLYIVALETGEPLHFAWRIHIPPNYTIKSASNVGSSSTGWRSDPAEFIARVRFRENADGQLDVYQRFEGSSSRSSFHSPAFARLISGHWKDIKVEQLGSAGVVEIDPKDTVTLVRLTLPEALEAKAKGMEPEIPERLYKPDMFQLELGPKAGSR